MENAYEFKYECEKVHEQGDVILPILDVWRLDFNWKRFLGSPATYWNAFEVLKGALAMKTVLKFFVKNANFVLSVLAQLSCSYALGYVCICM